MTMTMANPYAAQQAQLRRDAILSATPEQLLVMMYDRLLLDLRRAEAAQLAEKWTEAGNQLTHAQAIVAELNSSLKDGIWDGSDGLRGLYGYVNTAMVEANIQRDVRLTQQCIELLDPLREAWHQAAETAPTTRPTGGLGVA